MNAGGGEKTLTMPANRLTTPREAEAAFYAAFVGRDLKAMMAVWADDEAIACIHPLGEAHTGCAAVRRGWQAVFRNSPPMKFTIEERHRMEYAGLAVHVVHEHIRVENEPARAPVIATNAYRLTPAGWRMILHHASPAPASKPLAPETLH